MIAAVKDRVAAAPSRGTRAILIVAITAGAAALRFWGIGFGLPHTYARPDEDAIVTIATRIFQYGPDPRYFVYPTAYLYLVAFVYDVYYTALSLSGHVLTASAFLERLGTDPTPFYLLTRITAAVMGTATVPLLFYAAVRLHDARTGAIAAALLAAAFLHVRDSHFGVTDIPATCMTMLAFWAIVRYDLDRTDWRQVLGVGALCGLAASTKYNVALIAIPLFVRIAQQSRSDAHRTRWTLALCLLGLCGIGAGFLAGTPFAPIEARTFFHDVSSVQAHFVQGHGVDLGRGWTHHLFVSLQYGLGTPVLVAALIGAAWLALTAPATAAVALSFPMAYYAVIGAGRTVFVRYADPILPFGCLLAAVTIARVAARVEQAVSRPGATAVAIVLTGVVAWPSLERSVALDGLLAQRDTRLLAAEWLESSFPPGTTICQTGTLYGLLQSRPPGRFPECEFDEPSGMLRAVGSRLQGPPQLVVIERSPLSSYPGYPEGLVPWLGARYRSIHVFSADRAAPGPAPFYDQQDAFFVPLDGFEHVSRPGPTVEVFERATPPPSSTLPPPAR